MFLGVDTGGTFTDFVLFDGASVRFHKELSTPENPSLAIERGIQNLGLNARDLHLIHGSTVATNAILERKGVKTLFITNKGLEDLLIIGRQTRPELYSLTPDERVPWIHSDDCMGLSGRINADGVEIEPTNRHEFAALANIIEKGDYKAVAVCQLFSFLNNSHEKEIASGIPDGPFVSLSHEVVAEYREYERGATTFLNAYVGPLVQRYLKHLEHTLAPKHLFVMHSSGGVMAAEAAGCQAVKLALSGPAGGLVAAQAIGRQLGESKLITFDMGGTSTDVSLIRGEAAKTTESEIAGIPIALPMLDIHTIGAGGGSLAWIDEAGLPQVGPESAGASPGPVCYGLGGQTPAVTDANLVLGRIPPTAKLAGSMLLDREAALVAFEKYGETLGLGPESAAEAVIRIAEEHMAGALRVVSVQRGHNPDDFALLCFGGAGGLHACALADALGMRRVVVPLASGAFSALGMLAGRQQGDYSRSKPIAALDGDAMPQLQHLFGELEQEAAAEMEGLTLQFERRVDMRYMGQGFQLTVPMHGEISAMIEGFTAAHLKAYGHSLDRPVEIVTARLTAFVERPELSFPNLSASEKETKPCDFSTIYGVGEVPQYLRSELRPGCDIAGPALVIEETSTLWISAGWRMNATTFGHLLLERCHGF
ncbi:N-methylhydantoinase A [Mariprofundus ferrinatatus]|uniref:N-methylhydantoinase A n=1 Tax=Mariprofundus ferrinatatus TaxID=1921087 RepID=A0A2K8L6H0_9PROT|nr:hydantoinase/oxoprolinase family protein [Mariprofundus ferrinatatus]ATX81849.1 N-methylhydantoinase A [Mariprofundus ferrinatatus]